MLLLQPFSTSVFSLKASLLFQGPTSDFLLPGDESFPAVETRTSYVFGKDSISFVFV